MLIITGAYGFIGSCLLSYFNHKGRTDVLIVDDFTKKNKTANLTDKTFSAKLNRQTFIDWLEKNPSDIECVFHIGARTDTAEFDYSVLETLNLEYSKAVWRCCTKHNIPLIYASSAATYGDGTMGFNDDHSLCFKLNPLNPYGRSKNEFDKWALRQEETPPFWAGFKFFNVYGPNEYHKGRMASVMYHFYLQVRDQNKVRLFKSHKTEYKDGAQKRDFIHVHDLLSVMDFFMENKEKITSGIYNLGTGLARTYNDLARAIFKAMEVEPNIVYFEIPLDIRESYQYFTEARMGKLRAAGYTKQFIPLEKGIEQYVKEYLIAERYY